VFVRFRAPLQWGILANRTAVYSSYTFDQKTVKEFYKTESNPYDLLSKITLTISFGRTASWSLNKDRQNLPTTVLLKPFLSQILSSAM
jgi:hypothetical protein